MHIVALEILTLVSLAILVSFHRNYQYDNRVIIDKKLTCQLKGIAIILVLLAHMTLMCYLDLRMVGNFGAIGVDIFLILSGYGIYKSYLKSGISKEFIIKRLKKIYLPFIIVIGFEVFWRIYRENVHYTIFQLIIFFTGFDLKRTLDGTYWYISFILLWYLIFSVIYKISKNKILNIILLFYFSYLFKLLRFVEPISDLSWQYSIHFIVFPVGVLIANYEKKILNLLTQNAYKLVILVLFIGSISVHYIFLYNKEYYWLYSLNLTIFFMVIAIFLQHLGFVSKLLDFVGGISYEIYLVEMQILIYFNFPSLVGGRFLGNIIEILACIVAGGILRVIIKAIERIGRKIF
ncbi:acyltransferase family protein [Clostridium hydrogenum]|uniref:acyltransferase family protein n=1 Tax=Clostridium hydrogenum TaxID=2855764 RepID=UPI001F43E943|nr:acyltransferase [Clostridium hydrogenum]